MANANESIITGKFRGGLGKELVFRKWAGKTIAAKFPGKPADRTDTVSQKAVKVSFLKASHYAKAILRDDLIRAAYGRALKPRQNLYSRAMKDFLTPPVVDTLDVRRYAGRPGDGILVGAYDDFRVTGVEVAIYDASGVLLEQGPAALQQNGVSWLYTVTREHAETAGCTVRAVATDLPGREGSLEVIL